MGGVPVKHHTHSKVGRRRSHLALRPANLLVCPNCGAPVKPHHYCSSCGFYKNRTIKQK
ncbi:50S ribosomal protein L32 [Candidatus Wolfebacteria bacterium CG03_land_8_20_14_0_80_36_15]|uniref:Large ribosomal subunit protein bL32 n=1 Tax=Candidatus Wolfebacteria bacterium CG03_land_8_20_14_0_80_36_15 TaxID=1975067 RepID=A0A2M7B8D0_9BACT|nr:MAG: 50S ribosomal protein L32 [Candidatus Wolfebacteria bacterium CG03_land_8_20_14_0_80_36_15]